MHLLDFPLRWFPNHRTVYRSTFWRLFECKNRNPHSLFHGNGGSRAFPLNRRVEADLGIVYDGSGGSRYISGFHLTHTFENAEEYLQRFRADRELVICPVKVTGFVWDKVHSNSPIVLSRSMRISAISWEGSLKQRRYNPTN